MTECFVPFLNKINCLWYLKVKESIHLQLFIVMGLVIYYHLSDNKGKEIIPT